MRPPRQGNALLRAIHTQQGHHPPGFKAGELFVQRDGFGERVEDDRFWVEQAFYLWGGASRGGGDAVHGGAGGY